MMLEIKFNNISRNFYRSDFIRNKCKTHVNALFHICFECDELRIFALSKWFQTVKRSMFIAETPMRT